MDDESNVVRAQNSDTQAGDLNLYAVIGPTVNSNFGRTWKRELEDAVNHGRKLMRQNYNNHGKRIQKLYVVRVVEVLEMDDTPPIARRKASAEDFPEDD